MRAYINASDTGTSEMRYAYRRYACVRTMPARTITGCRARCQNPAGGIAAGDLKLELCGLRSDGMPDTANVIRSAVSSNIGSNGTTNFTFDTPYTCGEGERLAFVISNVASDPTTKYVQLFTVQNVAHFAVPSYIPTMYISNDSGSTWFRQGYGGWRVDCSDGDILSGHTYGSGGMWSGLYVQQSNTVGSVFCFKAPKKLYGVVADLYRVGTVDSSVRAFVVRLSDYAIVAESTTVVPCSALATGAGNYIEYVFEGVPLTEGVYYGIGWRLTTPAGDTSANYVRPAGINVASQYYGSLVDTVTTEWFGSFRGSVGSFAYGSDCLANTAYCIEPQASTTSRPLNLSGGFSL